jgi:hypothetical protein
MTRHLDHENTEHVGSLARLARRGLNDENLEQSKMLQQLKLAAESSQLMPVLRAQHLLDRVMLELGLAAQVRAVPDGIECSWGTISVVTRVDGTELHVRAADGSVSVCEATFEQLSAALC